VTAPRAIGARRSALVPKLVTSLASYDRQQLARDALAGVVVGIVALPLAIAFAIASGVTPERGLWTAIVAGVIVSALGGSRVQIAGPTGAFVVIVSGIVQRHGVDGLLVATMMAGVMLMIFGVAKLGAVIKFIPHPVITGFTSGIAVIIFATQVQDFRVSPTAVGIAALALAIIVFWPRLSHRVPAPFVALIVTTALVQLAGLDVETVGSRFGAIPSSVPEPRLPTITWATMTALIGPAFTIAMLGAIESLLSAVVADGMIGGRHRSNMELVAQGVANIASPIFGGIPATGAIARTATNVKNGGRTPVAGIVHALTLLVITLAAAQWAALIPMATLAAILAVVAYHMSEWRAFKAELRSPRSDVAVLLVTFGLTVLVDLTVAIEVGMVLAAFLFIRRMAEVTNVNAVTRELEDDPSEQAFTGEGAVSRRRVPAGVEVYEINGPFFFGAAELFKDTLARIAEKPKVLIIRMRSVLALDSTGMHALRDVVHRSRQDGTIVLLSDVHMQPLVALTGSPVLEEIGKENVFSDLDLALRRADSLVGVGGGADVGSGIR
jgi:SulP family sulfate permease